MALAIRSWGMESETSDISGGQAVGQRENSGKFGIELCQQHAKREPRRQLRAQVAAVRDLTGQAALGQARTSCRFRRTGCCGCMACLHLLYDVRVQPCSGDRGVGTMFLAFARAAFRDDPVPRMVEAVSDERGCAARRTSSLWT